MIKLNINTRISNQVPRTPEIFEFSLSIFTALPHFAVGGELDQSVFSVINPSNQGAGIPDGALFVDTELDDVQVDPSGYSRSPERGVIEAKPPSESNIDTTKGEQGHHDHK